MKNKLVTLAFILVCMVTYVSISHAEMLSKEQIIQEDIKEMKAAIAMLNENLPKRIDKYTIMKKIKPNYNDNGFIYSYIVLLPITEEMKKQLNSNVLHMIRSKWCTQTWFNNSIYPPIVSFIYGGTKNTQAVFIFNKYDCN